MNIYALFCSSDTSKDAIATAIFVNLVIPLMLADRKRVYDNARQALQPISHSLNSLLDIAREDEDDEEDEDYMEEEEEDVKEQERPSIPLFDSDSDIDSDSDEAASLENNTLLDELDELYAPFRSTCPAELVYPSPFTPGKSSTLDSAKLKFSPVEQAKINVLLAEAESSDKSDLEYCTRELYYILLKRGLELRKECATAGANGDPDRKVKMPRMCFSLDGAKDQLDVISELLAPLTKQQRMEILKYAGGSSSFEQPNDLMKGFMIFRRFIKSAQYGNWDPTSTACSAHVTRLEEKLTKDGMKKSSKEGYLKLFHALEFIVQRAWSASNVQKGWEILSAARPGQYDSILEMSSRWSTLNKEQKQQVRSSIHPLAETMATDRGFMDERVMRNLLGDDILGGESDTGSNSSESDDDTPIDKSKGRKRSPPKSVKNLEELTLNRQRAVVVSGERARHVVSVRAQVKALNQIHADLKKSLSMLPSPPLPSVQPIVPLASSTSSAAPSSSSSSSSSAPSVAAPASTIRAAAGLAVQGGAAAAAAAPTAKKVVKKILKTSCEHPDCDKDGPTDLSRCDLCYMTFCQECFTDEKKVIHQNGKVCKKLSYR